MNYTFDDTLFPWDDVKHFTPTWAEIAGKAHLYSTTRLRTTGEIVKILAVDISPISEPQFIVEHASGCHARFTTEQLCGFVI